MGNKADCTGGPIFNICIVFTRSEQHMGNKHGPMVGSTFNICTAFYVPWSDIWVTKLIPWGVDIQHLYCFLYALEHHMGNKADPMGRSILNIGIVFLHALDRHMDNKTDPVGGPIFNLHCFLHALNSIRVTKNNPRSDQYSTCVCFFTCSGATYG